MREVSLRLGGDLIRIVFSPDRRVHELAPQSVPALSPVEIAEEIRRAVLCRSWAPRRRGGARVVIAVDDHTRKTPHLLLLPPLLAALDKAGVRPEEIAFVVALGTHDPPSRELMAARYGAGVVDRYRWIVPDPGRTHDYLPLGRAGHPAGCYVHAAIVQADHVVGVGIVVPHDIAGYSGGGKIILPGCAAPHTTGRHHMAASRSPRLFQLVGDAGNDVRKKIEECAALAGLEFIVNVVPDGEGGVAGVFCGDPVVEHRRACKLAERIYRPVAPEPIDVAIVESRPCDIDYWQAIKAYANAAPIVKEGGLVVLVTPCEHGLCGNASRHARDFALATSSPESLEQEALHRDDLSGLSTIHLHAKLRRQARLAILSPGLDEESAAVLGAEWCATPDSLQASLDRLPPEAAVAVLHDGGWTAPRLTTSTTQGSGASGV